MSYITSAAQFLYFSLTLATALPRDFGIGGHIGQYDKPDGKYDEYSIWMSVFNINIGYSGVTNIRLAISGWRYQAGDIRLATKDTELNDLIPPPDRKSRLYISHSFAL